jgi:hypothetical protein
MPLKSREVRRTFVELANIIRQTLNFLKGGSI